MDHSPIQNDLNKLRVMLVNLSILQLKLENKLLPLHEVQILEAAIVCIKELIINKTNDIKRYHKKINND